MRPRTFPVINQHFDHPAFCNAAGRARASIQSLTALVPQTALLEESGQTREVSADGLAVGAIILVRHGDRMPADGLIVSGASSIDESPVTGESTPVRKGAGAPVFAGTIHGGDRLPWVAWPDTDNFVSLQSMEWQLHIYGAARPDFLAVAKSLALPCHEFAWADAAERAGLPRDAAYLVRPDGHVALALPDAGRLRTFVVSYGLTFVTEK